MSVGHAYSLSPGSCPLAGQIALLLEQQVQPLLRDFETLPPASLLALEVEIPGDWLDELQPRAPIQWQAPQAGMRMWATDILQCYESAADYRDDRKLWQISGSARPVVFFTLPPATETAGLRISLPKILLCSHDGRASLTLCIRQQGQSAAHVLQDWQEGVQTLFRQNPPVDETRITASRVSPADAVWKQRVRASSLAIREGRLAKVVLARRMEVELSQPADMGRASSRLAENYPGCHILHLPYGAGHVLAATPELLVARRGRQLSSHALAGTVSCSTDGESLLVSAKERLEHALVVEDIRERLQKLCLHVEQEAQPSLLVLRFVQHLRTQLSGELLPGRDLLDAVLALHPTPAVLGTPPAAAREWLRESGEQRDGLYTGVAGWLDAHGDGDAVVILRAAWLQGRQAVLWAGAGIMADSDPQAELNETGLKFQTMLEILNPKERA